MKTFLFLITFFYAGFSHAGALEVDPNVEVIIIDFDYGDSPMPFDYAYCAATRAPGKVCSATAATSSMSHGEHVAALIGRYSTKRPTIRYFDLVTRDTYTQILWALEEISKIIKVHPERKFIINLSLGAPFKEFYDKMDEFVTKYTNVIVVQSAGNESTKLSLENASRIKKDDLIRFLQIGRLGKGKYINVGTFDYQESLSKEEPSLASYSNSAGEAVNHYITVDAHNVIHRGKTAEKHESFNGTSAAAPLLSFEMANILVNFPSLTVEEASKLLFQSLDQTWTFYPSREGFITTSEGAMVRKDLLLESYWKDKPKEEIKILNLDPAIFGQGLLNPGNLNFLATLYTKHLKGRECAATITSSQLERLQETLGNALAGDKTAQASILNDIAPYMLLKEVKPLLEVIMENPEIFGPISSSREEEKESKEPEPAAGGAGRDAAASGGGSSGPSGSDASVKVSEILKNLTEIDKEAKKLKVSKEHSKVWQEELEILDNIKRGISQISEYLKAKDAKAAQTRLTFLQRELKETDIKMVDDNKFFVTIGIDKDAASKIIELYDVVDQAIKKLTI